MNKTIRILHLTTHNEECGIARYQEQFVAAMKPAEDITHTFFHVSPNVSRFMTSEEYDKVLQELMPMLDECDVLHIQHELSFYKHRELASVISAAHRRSKKVIVTIHTALDVEYKKAKFSGLRPREIRQYIATLRAQKRFEEIHLNPLKNADLIIVHNNSTKTSLQNHGFDSRKINIIKMPVPKLSFKTKTTELHEALHVKKGDVVYCTVGFISRSKGIDHAVKALKHLPDNYKLAIIGGLHPSGGDKEYLNEIQAFITEKNLKSRVHITGFVEDDDRLNALIREADVCVYPYDPNYYSYVSSAALSNALANHQPVVAYPTKTIEEINQDEKIITFCDRIDPQGLADALQAINIEVSKIQSASYAERHAYDIEALKFADIYRLIVS